MKIVYFDYWTEGIHNFVPLNSELIKKGHETILLHVGSFNFDVPREEIIHGILCRDVKYYKTSLIYKMLEIERPDIVITLNTTLVLDRALALSCRSLNIKSIFLMHGIRNLGSSNEKLVELMEKTYNSIFTKFAKIGKYLNIVIPNYVYSQWMNNKYDVLLCKFVKVLYSYFDNPGRSMYFPKYSCELLSDKCLVYSNNDSEYYEKIGYDKKDIAVVGNPKYDSFFNSINSDSFSVSELPQSVRDVVRSGGRYALYLDEGFPAQGEMGGVTIEKRREFVAKCAERLYRDGILLVVKLHPVSEVYEFGDDVGNCIIEDCCLDGLIKFSEFCICSFSTTINNCVLMGKPVLVPKWMWVDELPSFFIDVGVSRPWAVKDDPLDLDIDEDSRNEYIEKYITITTPTSVHRVIDTIEGGWQC